MKIIGFILCFIAGGLMQYYGVPKILVVIISAIYAIGLLLLIKNFNF